MRPYKARILTTLSLTAFVLTGSAGSYQVSVGGHLENSTLLNFSAIAKATDPDKKSTKYTCPMHPHYIANEMGSCPICGMDLVPLMSGGNDAAIQSGGVKRQSVTIAAETIQNMGVRTAKAETARFGRQIRAYGIVKENDKLQYVISNRLDGWIEKLNVRAVGDPVRKGAELYRMYSSELYVSQRDYLTALKAREKTRIRSIEIQLRSFGMQDKAIRKLARSRKAMMQVPFYAESSGTISELSISKGSFVKRGAMVAKIQDYSKVWLMVSVAEQDLGFLNKNGKVGVTFPTLKNRNANAKIDYIYPTVDTGSRTGQVRLVIDNKDGMLRPGTYADVVFEVESQNKLAVPTESLLNSETGRYVIFALGEGRYEPRIVKTGLVTGRRTEVLEGLKSGDEIVVSGQFLLDSESALHESFRKLERLQTPLPLLTLDKSQMAMVDHLIDAALYLHEAQIDGYEIDPKFIEPAREIKNLLWRRYQHTQLGPILKASEKAIVKAQKARSDSQFHGALSELVTALRPWILEGKPDYYKGKNLSLFEEEGEGRLWVQLGDKPLNPFGNRAALKIPFPSKKEPGPATPVKADDKKLSMSDGEHNHAH